MFPAHQGNADADVGLQIHEHDINETRQEQKQKQKQKQRKVMIVYIPSMFVIYLSIYLFNIPDRDYILDTSKITLNRIHTLYTYSLFHLNNIHLAFNLFALTIYGIACEYEQGPLRTTIINTYAILIGAVGAVLQARATNTDSLTLGASGGIYGLLSSNIGFLLMNWKHCMLFKRIFYPVLLISSCLSDIVIAFVFNTNNVSYGTHLGGFIAGAFMSIAISRTVDETVDNIWCDFDRLDTSKTLSIINTSISYKTYVRIASGCICVSLPLLLYIH